MKIYDQHRAAFANVSAFVVVHKGERVGTIAFKFPRDGAGRLYAYVHWLGTEMVRGSAGGYGYDKRGASLYDAGKKLAVPAETNDDWRWVNGAAMAAFKAALNECSGGIGWETALRNAGFDVWSAV